jgi:hypothetical protein
MRALVSDREDLVVGLEKQNRIAVQGDTDRLSVRHIGDPCDVGPLHDRLPSCSAVRDFPDRPEH